jgi:hypothetical protein
MKPLLSLFVLLGAAWLAAPAGAQPDRAEALAKAKARFEADIPKAEDALVASMDKALKAAPDKAAAEKLTYEREQFAGKRVVPTSVSAAAYLKQRAQAVAALEAVYLPAIKELTGAKKDDEAAALEGALGDLLKAARGYGLAFPDLESRPTVLIVNKGTGLVLDPANKDGRHPLVLTPKKAANKAGQGWQPERGEKGYVFRHDSHALYANRGGLEVIRINPKRELSEDTAAKTQFYLTEVRRDVVISARSDRAGDPRELVFVVVEGKGKDGPVYDVSLERKGVPPAPNQLWTLVEIK